ncbi:MAG: glycine--tRNA ligase subunit beta, partial [Terriglobales bacterium]
MPALWIELGCEEIPARWVAALAQQMAERIAAGLREARLLAAEAQPEVRWTPRRLVARFADVPARQPGRVEELIGPPAAIAFAADGSVTPQGAGFAAKCGLPANALYRTRTAKGEYAALKRESRGEPAVAVLAERLPHWITGMDLPKAMRWDCGGFKFVRPVRWWSVLLDAEVVAARLGGLTAGRATRPHPTLGGPNGGAVLDLADAAAAEPTLARDFVVLDPGERRRRILAGLEAALAGTGLRARPDAALLELLVNLTEWPAVVAGAFAPAFLQLPAEVLVTVMRDHQKYFAVEEADGAAPGTAALAPRFLAVMDLDADREGLVRHGHERVLRARFKDAEFFWQADRKRSLASRAEDLRAVTFHARLGSYYDKTVRVIRLARLLAAETEAAPAAAA